MNKTLTDSINLNAIENRVLEAGRVVCMGMCKPK